MTAYTQAQRTVVQIAEQFTPELKRRIIAFTVASLVLGLLAVLLLALFKATYEPLTWTVLVLTGAAYGWFAREELTTPDVVYVYDDDDTEEENDNQASMRYQTVRLYEEGE